MLVRLSLEKKSFENRTTAKEDCAEMELGRTDYYDTYCIVHVMLHVHVQYNTGDGSRPSGSNPDIIISSR